MYVVKFKANKRSIIYLFILYNIEDVNAVILSNHNAAIQAG